MTDYITAVIIWLDRHIGSPNEYRLLKQKFYSTLDPEWPDPTCLDDININKLIKYDISEYSLLRKSSAIEMYAFSNEEDCARQIQEYKGKRIFFIVSNSLGKYVVPKIIKTYPEVFQKSDDNQNASIYVFCGNIIKAKQCAINYKEYVKIFDHETNLLEQLTRDIGNYFFSLGQQQYPCETPVSARQSLKYFCWAKTLFMRADKVEKKTTDDQRARKVSSQIIEAEALLQQLTNDDDDYYMDHYMCFGQEVNENIKEMHQSDELNLLSSPFESEMADTESSFLEAWFDAPISTDNIEEKVPVSTKKLVDNQQDNSDVRVYLLLPSPITKDFENINSILKEVLGEKLFISSSEQDYSKLLEEQVSLVVILPPPTDSDDVMLERLCSFDLPPQIYLLGQPPNTASERQAFFTKYSPVRGILDNPEELAVKIIIDIALKSRIMGDRFNRNKDKDRANKMYDQCIELLNRLNVLTLKNTDNKD